MSAQLRIYRIKDGMMDEWQRLFTERMIPAHTACDIEVTGCWVNPDDPSEFVWMRKFRDDVPVADQEAAYAQSPGRAELGNLRERYIDEMDARTLVSLARENEDNE